MGWGTCCFGDPGRRIHYATIGEGPLVVMIHGFPDFWYSWRHQMPVLAEAAVLLMGTARLSWRQFFPAVALSNLGIAPVYAVLGHFARSQGQFAWALAASIALPVLATTMARWLLPRKHLPPQSE